MGIEPPPCGWYPCKKTTSFHAAILSSQTSHHLLKLNTKIKKERERERKIFKTRRHANNGAKQQKYILTRVGGRGWLLDALKQRIQ
jgi:hypothetical protein